MSARYLELGKALSALSAHISAEVRRGNGVAINVENVLRETNLLRTELRRQIETDRCEHWSAEQLDAVLGDLAALLSSMMNSKATRETGVVTELFVKRFARKAALFTGLAAGLAVTVPAAADTTTPSYVGMTQQDIGVMDRARPEYDAKGIPMGGFRLFPILDVSGNYDSNVFKIPAATSDFYLEEAPSFRLQSQWGRHFLELYAGLDNFNYSKYSRLDLTDWNIGTDGRLDVSRSVIVNGAASYGEYHESLSSPNTVGFQASPNRYDQGHADLSGSYQPNRLGFGIGGSYDRYTWLNTPVLGGGTLFNSDRNETETQAYGRMSYDFSPGYSGFVKALYDDRSFDHFFDRNGLHRSSTGYHLDAGLDVQISHLVSGEVFAGYLDQKFAAPLNDVSGLDYGVGLHWYASPVLTVHLEGKRQLSDTVLGGVSVSDDKTVKLSADYEFRRNIILQGFVGYTNSRYVGTTRTDDLPSAGISLHYYMDRHVSADVGYTYSKRSSSTAAVDYNDNLVSAGITLHI